MTLVGVTLPGTSITHIIERVFGEHAQKTEEGQLPVAKLGAGLIQSGEDILAVKAGVLQFLKPNKLWIESRQRRVPSHSNAHARSTHRHRMTWSLAW